MKYILSIITLAFLSGCYYDDPDILDPNRLSCDTTIVTFSGAVKPILTAYCTGCHSGPNAPLSVTLDNYAGVKAQAANGKLLGTITHSVGFTPMPQNGTVLSSCNIARIKKWIATGSLNN